MPQTFNVGARSLFVTTTAWVAIVLSAIASAAAVVQNALVASVVPLPSGGANLPSLPLLTNLLLGYLPWVVGTGLLMSLLMLASAIGLLWRLDWARRAFIGVLLVAIVANLLGLWLQHEVVESVVSSTLSAAALPPKAAGVFGGFVTAARVMAALVTLGTCAVFGWVIRRLMSASVRQEFA